MLKVLAWTKANNTTKQRGFQWMHIPNKWRNNVLIDYVIQTLLTYAVYIEWTKINMGGHKEI